MRAKTERKLFIAIPIIFIVVVSVGLVVFMDTRTKVPYVVRVDDLSAQTGTFTITAKVTSGGLTTTMTWECDYGSWATKFTPRMFPLADNSQDQPDVLFEISFSDTLDVVRITMTPSSWIPSWDMHGVEVTQGNRLIRVQ